MRLKHCPDCDGMKPLDEFPRNRTKRDGRGSRCRLCEGARVRAYQERKRQEMGEDAWLARQRDNLRRHRERTGNARGRAYDRAWHAAARELIHRHPDEFDALFSTERALGETA